MILAVLQARMGSTRLPGKVLQPILGVPMLGRQIERVRRARRLDHLVVAIGNGTDDDPLADFCAASGVACFRGSPDDVLDRTYRAASAHGPEHVVRLTGDCPLADPELIDAVIQFHCAGGFDYSSNTLEPTFPDGLDVEVMTFATLEQAFREARLAQEREHVTQFVYRRPERFGLGSYRQDNDLSYLRWTVDEPADLELVTRIYSELYPINPDFTTGDLLDLLSAQPELAAINAHHRRNEGLTRRLAADAALDQEKSIL